MAHRTRQGFTLIEIIVVMAILAITGALAIPAVMSFMETGRRINRMNAARTLYLASQHQLIKLKMEQRLKSTLTGYYYKTTEINAAIYTNELDEVKILHQNVSNALQGNFPKAGDKDRIHYIKKPANPMSTGFVPLPTATDAEAVMENNFYWLLDEVIMDKSILNNAILMEYDIETGIILSIFYGDAGQGEFFYMTDGELNDADSNDILENIFGGRPYPTDISAKRRQGYYGAEVISPP
jgi:type IV pilus assembly protein PilA